MKNFKTFILLASISAVYCGGPSPCEPFVSEFLAFQQAWLNLEDHFLGSIIDITSVYPVLTPAIVLGLKCQTNSAIELVGYAINRLSGVDSSYVVSILNSTIAFESGTPLDCITNEIVYMQQRILTIFDDLVPLLENSIQTETTPNDCDEVHTRIEPFLEAANSISIRAGEILREDRQAFSSIGMEDLYLNHLVSQAPCFGNFVGTALGSLLNSDGNVVAQYLYEENIVLPYPFSCVQANLDYLKFNFLTSFVDLYYGTKTSIDFHIPS